MALPDLCFPPAWAASVGPAVLPVGSQVPVPADEHCLAYCLIAARKAATFHAMNRYGGGFICDQSLERTYANEARTMEATVVSLMWLARTSLRQAIDANPHDCEIFVRALADLQRSLTALEAGQIPDQVALLFYAHVMGGRILVQTEREGLRSFGREIGRAHV